MENTKNIQKKKKRKSILDPYYNEINELVILGITPPNITKIINNKLSGEKQLTEAGYRKYIKTKLNITQKEAFP